MYIKFVELVNIKCFSYLKLDFGLNGESIIISGDNGDGKSTILRAIAMGLTDRTSASALLRDLPGDLVRKGKKIITGSITIRLVDAGEVYEIITKVKSLELFEKVEQELYKYVGGRKKIIKNPDNFPWKKIFVCGYGAGLRTNGTSDYDFYTSPDAVYPIFRYDMPLQNPELSFRRIIDEGKDRKHKHPLLMRKQILSLLEHVLNLEPNEKVVLEKTGLKIITNKSGTIELSALGDGYRSTTTWVLDLLSWWMLYLESIHRKSRYHNKIMSGIVLVDEVEQHLHPKWQRKIISLIKDKFPRVQFIFTTHSPLVISGADRTPIHSLRYGKHKKINAEGWLAEDVYTEIMGINTSRSKYMEDLVDEFRDLSYKKIKQIATGNDKKRYFQIKNKLRSLGPTDPVMITSQLESLLKDIKIKNKVTNAKRYKTIKT